MPAGGEDIRLGPFVGGLNTASDPSAIKDTELSVCDNFDIDQDGALVSRPPITELLLGPVAAQTVDVLGYFIDPSGTNYLIGSTDNAVYYMGSGAWVEITTGFRARAMVQYVNKAWLVAEPGSGSNGGSWVPTSFGAAGTFTTIASMPKGMAAGIYKERLFVAPGSLATTNESRLIFSNEGDPTVWTGSDFVDINPGDGQRLIDIFVDRSNLYLFKTDSTYVYSFDADPAKGAINNLSKTVGVNDTGCVVQYENYLIVYHEDTVYELINGVYQKLNYKVDLVADFTVGTTYFKAKSLSLIGERLIVRYFDKIYVFSFKTRTWSTWSSTMRPSKWYIEPRDSNATTLPKYVAGAAQLNSRFTYQIQEGYDNIASEIMTCKATTKVFDFDSPGQFKRLFWWGIDCITTGTVMSTATPVIYTFNVQWSQLAAYTWAEMALFTWGQPGNTIPVVNDEADTAGSVARKFIKFLKALRFRSMFFTVFMQTTGTTATGPVKLFTINPVIGLKQRVPKKVN
jgi:hypothetical protein